MALKTLALKQYDTDIIAELTSEKNKAIEDLDFEKAEQVYNEIQKEISRRSTDSFAEILLNLSNSVSRLEEEYQKEVNNFAKNQQQKETKMRDAYKNTLSQYREEKDNKIKELEGQKQTKLSNPELDLTEYNEIISRAKQEAGKANFRGAKELKSEALYAKQREIERVSGNIEEEFKVNCKGAEDEFANRANSLKLKHMQEIYDFHSRNESAKQQMKNDTLSKLRVIYHKIEANVQALTSSDKEKKDMHDKIHSRFEEDLTRISSYKAPEDNAKKAEKENIPNSARTARNVAFEKNSFFVTAPNRPMTARSPAKRRNLNDTGGIIERTLTPDFSFTQISPRTARTARSGPRSPRSPRIVTPKSVFF